MIEQALDDRLSIHDFIEPGKIAGHTQVSVRRAENSIIVHRISVQAHALTGHEIGGHVLVHVLAEPDLQQRAKHLGIKQRHAERG